jgi:hypothetical protein
MITNVKPIRCFMNVLAMDSTMMTVMTASVVGTVMTTGSPYVNGMALTMTNVKSIRTISSKEFRKIENADACHALDMKDMLYVKATRRTNRDAMMLETLARGKLQTKNGTA